MANDIYSTTLGGLSELVSPRVAEGVLRRALAAVAVGEDEVDGRTMSRLLRGRIRRDLERSLPRGGLRRSLADIDARVLRLARDPSSATLPEAPSVGGGSQPRSGLVATAVAPEPTTWRLEPRDESDLPVRKRAFPIAADVRPAAGPAASSAADAARLPGNGHGTGSPPAPVAVRPPPRPVAHSIPAVAPPPPTVAKARPAPNAHPDPHPVPAAAVARVAEQDGVRQWVWASPAPGAAEGRGDGPEPARVDSEVRAFVSLLGRHGRLSSLHVRHGTGQVLVGIHGPSALVVAGDEGINVGAIYATFRALEEET